MFNNKTVDLLVLLSPEFDFTPEELTYEQCADVGNISGQLIYDLIYFARDPEELNIDIDFDIAFYEGLDVLGEPFDLILDPENYTNTSQNQVIYMTVADAAVTDSAGNVCKAIIPITLQIDNLPATDDYYDYVLCDDDYFSDMDEHQIFDLPSQLPNMIAS